MTTTPFNGLSHAFATTGILLGALWLIGMLLWLFAESRRVRRHRDW